MEIENATGLEPVKTISDCKESILQPGDSTLLTEKIVQRVEQLQQMYAMHQRKVILKDLRSPIGDNIKDDSEYEGSDEKSPIKRSDMRRTAVKRPQSARLLSTSRPDSAKANTLQSSLKKASTFLLDALLSSQGCPGQLIQADALAASHQGQLECLFRLSVFIWPVWLDNVVSTTTSKLRTNSGVVLEMSHQELVHQLNSLCQAQESGQNKSVGQNDATVHHMVNVCVKRCSELLRAHDFRTTKQILQKIFQLSRRMATTAHNQLKLLPLKLIGAMLHVGDGNIRDAVFELRSAIESITVDHDSAKLFMSTDVVILYNHLSYYYSLLGSRAEACKYTKMGIEIMAENRSTMARSDMSSQYLSVDQVAARHQYIDAVLMINQVVAEVSNDHADIQAAKALCGDAVVFLEEVRTSATYAAHFATQLHPLFENIQKVLDGKNPAEGHLNFSLLSPGSPLLENFGNVKHVANIQEHCTGAKGNLRIKTMSASTRKPCGNTSSAKNLSATTKQSKLDMSASFGIVRSQSQIYSQKTPKAKNEPPSSTTRPSTGVRPKTASPKVNRTKNSKFKMLMLGPALAKSNENHCIPSLIESSGDKEERSTLPESLIRALFPTCYQSSKILSIHTNASTVVTEAQSPEIFDADVNEDVSFSHASKVLTAHSSQMKLGRRNENNHLTRTQHQSTQSNIHIQGHTNQHRIVDDINSLRICCRLMKSLAFSFDSLEESSQQHIRLVLHCASKLTCEICYLFKLEGLFPGSARATTLLSSGKQVSVDLGQGGIIATQMNRFLQNGVLMRPVVILDEDIFTETTDDFDREILPIKAEECSIMMGVVPGYSQFNKVSGFMMAIRPHPAASFDLEEQLICELLCNCCSQSLPLL
jgi:hypothetical protein